MSIRIFSLLWLIVLAIGIIPFDLSAQDWQLVESGVTSDLYDITFVNNRTGWAVGADSTIIKTTDGGHNWFRQYGGAPEEYRCVFFRDSLLGWIGGTMGTILHTRDGGDTWERQTNDDLYEVNRIEFMNDTLGWLGGTAVTYGCGHWGERCGVILKTTNGGTNWRTVLQTRVRDTIIPENSIDGRFLDIDFLNEQQGFAVASYFSDRSFCCGNVIYTSDGGETWGKFSQKTGGAHMYSVDVKDTNYLLIGGWCIARSRDMFHTYAEYFTPHTYTYDMSVPDTNHIYSLSNTGSPLRILLYRNGLTDPEEQVLEGPPISGVGGGFTKAHYMGIWMLDSTTGWVCGDSGRLWRHPAIVNPVDYPSSEVATVAFIESIYPNPVSAALQSTTLRYTAGKPGSTQIVIYDLFGREVYNTAVANTTPGEQQIELPLHGLQPGMYVVQASSGGGVRVGYTKLLVR